MSIGSISGFYMNGRPSGLPEDFEDQLVEVRRQQTLVPVQNEIEELQSESATFSTLQSKLGPLVSTSADLSETSDFDVFSIDLSDTDVLSATSNNQAEPGSYAIDVSQVAQAHNQTIKALDGISDAEDASLITDGIELSFYHEGTSYSYQTDSETTLTSLAEEINSEENGVQASVVNTGTEDNPDYIMTLKSRVTGDGQNRITTDSGGTTVGVSISGGDLFVGGQAQEEAQTGQNAIFTVDGVSYERSSNQVDDVIRGVSMDLLQSGSGVNLDVSQDTSAIVEKVQSFVSAYNEAKSYIESETQYNTESDSGGALLGSSLARRAESKMSNVIMEPISGTSGNAYSYLSDIGIQFQDNGTLKLDTEQLRNALETNPSDVQALFAGDNGAASKMNEAITSFTDSSDGAITYKLDSIDCQIDDLNDEVDEIEQELSDYQERLVEKYTHMENVISQYKSVQSQLEQMVEQWNTEA